jgi:hypothetical protein
MSMYIILYVCGKRAQPADYIHRVMALPDLTNSPYIHIFRDDEAQSHT